MPASTPYAVARGHRPPAVKAAVGVLGFLGISALAGGAAMVFGLGGAAPPRAWLDDVPVVTNWTVPGLVLGAGFGLGALITAYGVVRRPRWAWLRPVERALGYHWSWLATLLLGLGQVIWIALELAYLPQLSALQGIYGAVGLALLVLPLGGAMRRYLARPSAQRR